MLFAFIVWLIPLAFIGVTYWAFKKMLPGVCNDVTDKLFIVGSALWIMFALGLSFAHFAPS